MHLFNLGDFSVLSTVVKTAILITQLKCDVIAYYEANFLSKYSKFSISRHQNSSNIVNIRIQVLCHKLGEDVIAYFEANFEPS